MATTLVLAGELTIAQAATQREALLAALAGCDAVLTLELSGVEAFDSSGVQLLLAARRSIAERGGTLGLQACSPPVMEALRVYGLHDLFGFDPAHAAPAEG